MAFDRIGIIAALQIELEAIKAKLSAPTSETVSGIEFTSGEYCGKQVIAAMCGVGKVFAAVCAEIMILKYAPELIINTGIAGGLAPGMKAGDIVICEAAVQHDMDTSPLGDEVGLVSGINIVKFPCDRAAAEILCGSARDEGLSYRLGTVASGDCFVASDDLRARIRERFDADACDMETAAIAHVCYINEIPFAAVRTASDGAGEDAGMDYISFCKIAAARSAAVTERFLKSI